MEVPDAVSVQSVSVSEMRGGTDPLAVQSVSVMQVAEEVPVVVPAMPSVDPFDLASILRAVPREVLETVDVDVTDLVPGAVDPIVFTLKDLNTQDVFATAKDAGVILKLNPGWPLLLCNQVAALGLAHVSPKQGMPPGRFYMEIADKNSELFGRILGAYLAAFPHQSDFQAEAKAEADFLGTV